MQSSVLTNCLIVKKDDNKIVDIKNAAFDPDAIRSIDELSNWRERGKASKNNISYKCSDNLINVNADETSEVVLAIRL